jgi:molybdopterin converting factor subunit 1
MRVRVLYFARVAEIAGCAGEEIQVDDGACAGDVLAEVARRHPEMARPDFKPLLAVNRRHADPGLTLADGDEVAVFPPVSGG